MNELDWKPYGREGFEAAGADGVWRIVKGSTHWWLTFQPHFTRGMLNRGKFIESERARAHAQERENGVPIVALGIGPT
jgi:hypothetical protein